MILMFDATVNNIAVVISTYILFILDLINMGKYVPKYLKYFHIKKHVFLRVNCYITQLTSVILDFHFFLKR